MAQAVKERRLALGFTQSDLAELADVSLRTIRSMEKGSGQSSITYWQKTLAVLGLEMIAQTKQATDA